MTHAAEIQHTNYVMHFLSTRRHSSCAGILQHRTVSHSDLNPIQLQGESWEQAPLKQDDSSLMAEKLLQNQETYYPFKACWMRYLISSSQSLLLKALIPHELTQELSLLLTGLLLYRTSYLPFIRSRNTKGTISFEYPFQFKYFNQT